MTFSEILAGVYEDTGYASSPAAAVVTRLKRYVNEGVRHILSEPGLGRLADSDSPITFASVASQARYVLPEAVARILHVTERTNDWALRFMDLGAYRRREPDAPSNTGTPTHLVPSGRVSVAVQPSNASEIFVKSTSASDTGTAFLEGLITGGYRRIPSVAMTGVTAVSLNTGITTFEEIEDFYLSAAAVGTVTLHEDSGLGTELARVTIGQKRPRYYAFYLWPTPAAAITYYVDYRRELIDLVQDADEPPLNTDFHPMLIAYAAMRDWEHKKDTDAVVIAKQRYERWLSKAKYFIASLSEELPVAGRRKLGHSRLGAYYPADTWTY